MADALLFKVLGESGQLINGGMGLWHLPAGPRPGRWMPPITGELVACRRGYHLCRAKDLLSWLGPCIYVAEARGDQITDSDKIVVRQARLLRKLTTWNEHTARLFAADCAEAVLPIFEKARPADGRPRQAIAAARKFARGEISAAARAAAGAAAWAAAGDAAGAAARAAAGAAARDAAWDAARAAAWDAAWAAARATARAAARATARAAAWDAAGATAWAAAWDAATTRLFQYLQIDWP